MDGIGSRESIQSIGSNATHDPTDDSTPFHLIPPPLVLVIRAITLISFVPGISNIYIYIYIPWLFISWREKGMQEISDSSIRE